ncbi:ERF family protein [Tenacibaculum sp.]|uniref:ERF family protein n=1 Tax=Tenacibaculum sp. TaxID=1906242 RepID=UPI003D131367
MENLIKIQNELKAPKNQYNAFGKYNYRSCEDILEALKPLLLKYNCTLTITDEIKEVGGIVFVEAIAKISDSKESKETKAQAGITPDKKGMDLSQSFGSSSSYARKYALNGLFLIDDTKDADTKDNSKNETVKQNTVAIPANVLKDITAKLEKAKTQEDLKELYANEISTINRYPSVKGMFTNKKVAINGNA